ncbi:MULTISPECIES: phage antirepressor KilAC domain-containing protein [Comamonas]|uniref:phage antirepressor KilAC domain-containing protein n=1 Tax=Comamonas TaxID=283 RepID=UPI0022DE7B3D|nr:phage antirepressor KilAC domain-containing protein [Comamonas aquatica]MDE1557306.1 phage antirepressor KilAC domain-containing protein [Comamonas aquatica]MDH0383219.1 phage antirepressor KilAC domain-containing protein [Comamonas aquatica]MDH0431224.1 phage antirepressor KilAC domain-containing protein [Comamonas aquatica]MDH0942321.1 phage antirepressor KilAC domain-containing protein [Comamonas aquatica]WBM43485.1 phage antirepressor KilAC domain-containing protein [Comamonas aquatica]
MNQLTVAGSAPLTMTSAEIGELVESRHDSVKRTIERLAERGVIQLPPLVDVPNHLGQTVSVYQLEKRDSLVVVAQLSPEFTARIVDRWQELEAQQAPALPATYLDALRAHLASEEKAAALAIEVQKKEQALVEAAPKVEFVERYVQASSGALGFRQVCKTLCLNEKWLAEFLELHQIMYRLGGKLTPYQQHIQAGRFEVKTGVSDSGYGYVQPKFTPKGVEWLAAEIAKHHAAKQMKALAA